MNHHYVFVYGTLRKGERNHYLLEGAELIAQQAWTKGRLFDTGLGYPALKESMADKVYGELYLVSNAQLHRLDELEGYHQDSRNNLYNRKNQVVFYDAGKIAAYLYFIAEHHENMLRDQIQSGDWKLYKFEKQHQSIPYFAYGSCMDDRRFKEEGVERYFQKVAGVGILNNYTLRFTHKAWYDGMGRADIVEEGGIVEGKVYEISMKALKEYLYAREGAPNVYRPTVVTIELNGKKVEALTFVVVNKKPETAPPDWYEAEILRGARGFLSDCYITNLQRHINSLKQSNAGGM